MSLALLIFPSIGWAVEIIVNSTEAEERAVDDGDCSLTEAILAASRNRSVDACPAGSSEEEDVIRLQPNATYRFANPSRHTGGSLYKAALPVLEGRAVIEGNGAVLERSAEAPPFRFFVIRAPRREEGSVILRNLTLRGGNVVEEQDPLSGVGGKGGAIFHSGSLRLEHCTLVGNQARRGEAVYSANTIPRHLADFAFVDSAASENGGAEGSIGIFYLEGNGNLERSRFRNNRGVVVFFQGGLNGYVVRGEENYRPRQNAKLKVVESLFRENGSGITNGPRFGARALPNDSLLTWGDLLIYKSSFLNNTGGGLSNSGYVYILNSAFVGNGGTAVYNNGGETYFGRYGAFAWVLNSTFANNTTEAPQPGGIYSGMGTSLKIVNSTLHGNTSSQPGQAGGLQSWRASVKLQNSILFGNGEQECKTSEQRLPGADSPDIRSLGNNLFGNRGNCRITLQPTDLTREEPSLGELSGLDDETAGNEHFPLGRGSAAMEAGSGEYTFPNIANMFNIEFSHSQDQVGNPRQGNPDLGAVEWTRDPLEGLPEGAIHYWTFDSIGPENTFPDVVAQSLTGTTPRAPVLQSGIQGRALALDGANDMVTSAAAAPIGAGENLTLAFWLYRNIPQSPTLLVLGNTEAPNDYKSFLHLTVNNEGNVGITQYGDDGVIGQSRTENVLGAIGSWQHVALTLSNGEGALPAFYVNGRPVSLSRMGGNRTPHADRPRYLRIGKSLEQSADFLNGRVDEAIVYNRPLSADEILQICRAQDTEGIACPAP